MTKFQTLVLRATLGAGRHLLGDAAQKTFGMVATKPRPQRQWVSAG